jgi:hypothetical protein
MDYKELSKKEKFHILDIAELALSGDKDVIKQLESITGIKFKTAADINKVIKDVHGTLSMLDMRDDLNRIRQRMTAPLPVRPKITPQERWQQKVGLISKSYKLKQTIVDDFAKACKDHGKSQAAVLTSLMQDWIDKNK